MSDPVTDPEKLPHPDRRDPSHRERMHLEVQDLRALVADLAGKMDAMQAAHQAQLADNAELLDIFRSVRGTLKVIGWLGKVGAWCLGLAAPAFGIWWTTKGGPHQ